MSTQIENYTNVSAVAELCGTDLRWVARAMRTLDIKPKATLGERQLGREDVVRLLLLAKMQRTLGPTSPTPWIVARSADDAIASMLRDPSNGAFIALRPGEDVTVAVSVSNLEGLVAVGA